MDKNRLAGEYADTYGNMGSDAWNNAYTCYLAGMDACQQLLQQAIEIFNEKANFNKWLLELTESEMSLVIEMMEEYRNQPSDNTQIRDGWVRMEDMEKEYKRGFDDGVKHRDGQHKAYFTIES